MQLTELQRDALREIGNLGSGRASSELSRLLDKKVQLGVPFIDIVRVSEVPKYVGGPKRLIVGTFAPVTGDLLGTVVVIFPFKGSLLLLDLLAKRPLGSTKVVDEEARGKLAELGGALSKVYLEAIATFLEMKLEAKDVRVISAFGEAISDFVTFDVRSDYAILLKSEFLTSVEGLKVEGDFVLLLALEYVEKVLELIDKKLECSALKS